MERSQVQQDGQNFYQQDLINEEKIDQMKTKESNYKNYPHILKVFQDVEKNFDLWKETEKKQ